MHPDKGIVNAARQPDSLSVDQMTQTPSLNNQPLQTTPPGTGLTSLINGPCGILVWSWEGVPFGGLKSDVFPWFISSIPVE